MDKVPKQNYDQNYRIEHERGPENIPTKGGSDKGGGSVWKQMSEVGKERGKRNRRTGRNGHANT